MNNEEDRRLSAVAKILELDFSKSSEFQDIVELAAQLCDKPVALITLLDKDSNWLKVKTGTDINIMPRETSFCQYGLQQDGLLIVNDATKDARFNNNPLVHSAPNLKFYAGAPLILNNGLKVGTLCLFDVRANTLTALQQQILPVLARQVIYLLELEMSHVELKKQVEQTEQRNETLMRIAHLQSHQIRQPLTAIIGLINLIKDDYQSIDSEWLGMFETATSNFDKTIRDITAETTASKDLRAIGFNKMVQEIDDYAILMLNEVGTVENWNSGAERIKGYSAKEIVGKNFRVFYTQEDIRNNRPEQLITKAATSGVARDEGWRLRKDGSKFWGSVVITAIHDDQRNVIGFTKVTRDLTTLKNAQDATLLSTDMYNQLHEQTNKIAQVGGWELDLANNTLAWTSVTKAIHDVDALYIPDLNDAVNFYKKGASRNKIARAVKLAIESGLQWDLKLRILTTQGKEKMVHSMGKSNFRDGVCTKVYGTIQDVTKAG